MTDDDDDDAGELGSREGVFSWLQHRMQSLLFHKETLHTGAGCRRAAGGSNATHKSDHLGDKYILQTLIWTWWIQVFCGWCQWSLICRKINVFFMCELFVGCRDELAVEGGACAFQSAPLSLQSSKTLQWRRQRSADSQPAWTLQSVWKMLNLSNMLCNSSNSVPSKMAAFLHVFFIWLDETDSDK